MGGITEFVGQYLQEYGYPVLFLVVLVESFGLPAPGQTLLIMAAMLAAAGHFKLWAVLATVFFAAVIGDGIGWFLGRRGGRRLILRYGRWIGLNRHRFRRLHHYFDAYSGWFVVFARFIDVARQINGLLAGSVKMPFARFLLFNALGAALWVTSWGLGSYYLGRGLDQSFGLFDVIVAWLMHIVAAATLLGLLYWLIRRLVRRRRPRVHAKSPAGPGSGTNAVRCQRRS